MVRMCGLMALEQMKGVLVHFRIAWIRDRIAVIDYKRGVTLYFRSLGEAREAADQLENATGRHNH